ncbi:hypothetical protein Ahy_A03g016001 [Arachis hypogaea]|uniref:DYW domain-containing protein n=1 Tax=Arachis hypogaea TaxID=3818 RepID=A0A445E204_ARAHY|nr:hypothetical protein Ahy_A03g016001 [Arachis hypogaea]
MVKLIRLEHHEIKFKIKAYGNNVENNLVLQDMGDEDKENVEITVRDRALFHRFKEGECSCRGYT